MRGNGAVCVLVGAQTARLFARKDAPGPRNPLRKCDYWLRTQAAAAMADPRAPAMSRSGTSVISAIAACST